MNFGNRGQIRGKGMVRNQSFKIYTAVTYKEGRDAFQNQPVKSQVLDDTSLKFRQVLHYLMIGKCFTDII